MAVEATEKLFILLGYVSLFYKQKSKSMYTLHSFTIVFQSNNKHIKEWKKKKLNFQVEAHKNKLLFKLLKTDSVRTCSGMSKS